MRSLWVGQRHIFLNLQYFQIQHQNSQMSRQTKEVTKLEDFYSFLSDFCETTVSCCVGETKLVIYGLIRKLIVKKALPAQDCKCFLLLHFNAVLSTGVRKSLN